MAVVEIAKNGRHYHLAPTLNLRVNTQLPQGAVLRVKRNGVVVGNALQTGQLTYVFTDSVNTGLNTYTADLVLEGLTLTSADYAFTTQDVPTPVIIGATNAYLVDIPSGSVADGQALIFTVSVTPDLLGDAYVDLFSNDVYIGTAERQTDTTKFEFTLSTPGMYAQDITAKVRVGAFSTTSAAFSIAEPIPETSVETYMLSRTPEGISIDAYCANRTKPGINEFLLDVVISASAESGTYAIRGAGGVALSTTLEEALDGMPMTFNHVQGVSTTMSFDTMTLLYSGNDSSRVFIIGEYITLVRTPDSLVLATTRIPSCGGEPQLGEPPVVIN